MLKVKFTAERRRRMTMKKCYYILLMLLLGGLSVAGMRIQELSQELKKVEAEEAWPKQKEAYIFWDDEAFGWYGHCRYYGTYGNAVVFMEEIGVHSPQEILSVAGESFYWLDDFRIRVYHEGKIHTLEEAYEQGILTRWNVKKVAKIHRRYVEAKDWKYR